MTTASTDSAPSGMTIDPVAFYNSNAELLAARYEALRFEDIHREILMYLPEAPGMVLDVGAGSGRDAVALCERGYEVVAVEPSGALRRIGVKLHPSPHITWVDDCLPHLEKISSRKPQFDAIFCSAVWMHMNRQDQTSSIKKISTLLHPFGRLFVTFRSQSIDDRPDVYETNAEDIIRDACEAGLRLLAQGSSADSFGRSEILWHSLVFEAN